jgi:4-hydroxy-tetrahydrodipicolinate reductase
MSERPLRLVVSGATGRMGRALAALAAEDAGVELIGGIGRTSNAEPRVAGYPVIEMPESAAALLERADAVIDFSAPALLPRLLGSQADALAGRALVVGTTGLEADDTERLHALSKKSPVLVAANFSVGVTLLLALAEEAARALGAEAWDVEIVEAHHRRKADAPSGTALALASAVAEGRGVPLDEVRRDGRSGLTGERPRGEIGLHALRGGGTVGEHRVLFLGERERIELAHVAADRALFAEGALRAARWLAGRQAGTYTMRDVVGLA